MQLLKAAQLRFEGPEIAEVVGRPDPHLSLVRAITDAVELLEQLEEHIGLQDDVLVVGRVAVRDGDLQLPRVHARVGDQLEQRLVIAEVDLVDLRIAGDLCPGLFHVSEGLERALPAADLIAQLVVRGLESVDRYRYALDAGFDHRLGARLRDAESAGGERRRHAALADAADDEQEVIAQVRLAADQHDLADARCREVIDQSQGFVGGELVGASFTGSRAAVQATVVAGERELPHRERRARVVHLAEHELAPAALGERSDDR